MSVQFETLTSPSLVDPPPFTLSLDTYEDAWKVIHTPRVFDALVHPDGSRVTEFDGDVGDIVDTLSHSYDMGRFTPNDVWNAARLVRYFIEGNIAQPTADNFQAVVAASQWLISFYSGQPNIEDFQSLIDSIVQFDTAVTQPEDEITYKASTDQSRLLEVAREIDEIAYGEDILFIALCHGGLVAGATSFLLREQSRPYGCSIFHPLRFSCHKSGDRSPQISEMEADYLRAIAEGKPVFVFDEDSFSGMTLEKATAHFQALFGHNRVHPITALDARSVYMATLGTMNIKSFISDKNQPGYNSSEITGSLIKTSLTHEETETYQSAKEQAFNELLSEPISSHELPNKIFQKTNQNSLYYSKCNKNKY